VYNSVRELLGISVYVKDGTCCPGAKVFERQVPRSVSAPRTGVETGLLEGSTTFTLICL
jgi:hypothetical protein